MAFLPALGAGFGALSSGFGVISSGNYVRAIKQVGKVAPVIGGEVRATIREAGDVAKDVLEGVNKTIKKTEESAKAVLTSAQSNVVKVIRAAGSESQALSHVIRDDLEELLKVTSLEAQCTLGKAGLELKGVIQETGKEAQKTGLLLSTELNKQILTTSEEVEKRLAQTRGEIQEIVDSTADNIKDVVVLTGQEAEQRLGACIDRVNRALEQRLIQIRALSDGLTEKVSGEAKGVIVDLGKEGKMLIQEFGKEFRISATAALKDLKEVFKISIGEAGKELRLAITAAGNEMRAIMAEVPYIAGEAGHAFGEGLALGIKDVVWKSPDFKKFIEGLPQRMRQKEANMLEILVDIRRQDQCEAYEKFEIYKAFRELIRCSGIPLEQKDLLFLYVGLVALSDKKLYHYTTSFCRRIPIDYADKIIEGIPGDREDKNSVYCLLKYNVKEAERKVTFPEQQVTIVPLIEENPLQKVLEEKEIELFNARLESGKRAIALEKTRRRLAAVAAERDARPREDQLEQLRERVGKLEQSNEKLLAEKNAAELKLNQLAESMSGVN
ncbi:MAG: hypothetical protein JSS30_03415 [Verrucomicrobia bacterium]|nr:hypothetical protein [Verrucomicrobiota bacterium]